MLITRITLRVITGYITLDYIIIIRKLIFVNQWSEKREYFNHYLLNNRQYVGLSKMFNLTYVPRYILIDKTGKIIDADAPRPWNELEIRHIIDKNL